MEEHIIARLVIRGKGTYASGMPNYKKLQKIIDGFVSETSGKVYFDFIVTPGGFLTFKFPSDLQQGISTKNLEGKYLPLLLNEAESTIYAFFSSISRRKFKGLQSVADYISIGVDGYNWGYSRQHIELVGIFDLTKGRVAHWSGKFYPTERQKNNLVKFIDLDSHFVRLNNRRVVILGCHDLNVFNPRGIAALGDQSQKASVSKKFRNKVKKFKPEVVLQHPHTTDTPNIWNLAWRTVEKEIPSVKHFASGVNYYYPKGSPRGTLGAVLLKSQKGDVLNFVF